MQGTVKGLKIKYKEFNLQRANLCTVNNHVLNIWTVLRSLAEYLSFVTFLLRYSSVISSKSFSKTLRIRQTWT